MHELILGGQRSGKSRCAERRAAHWLAQPGRSAVLLATALAGDAEMVARIAQHRADRADIATGIPDLDVVEVPRDLGLALRQHSAPQHLVLVDCLTLWLTNLLMPMQGAPLDAAGWAQAKRALLDALEAVPGPVLLVSNEIGWGLSPMGAEARHFVDELGRLHQWVAARCERVTMMVAGIEWSVKSPGVRSVP
ncbi:MAG: bifunctional adenosylcobinamide kinase/adenosylcobinamide-phosphate guanylyltransferase [Pseudorhodobacter sp.]|nr:bifunctional adenosylcobinamide kinase/adenosylcobinamide-phosphate guanylyltransferase [Rhizobacter sp.]